MIHTIVAMAAAGWIVMSAAALGQALDPEKIAELHRAVRLNDAAAVGAFRGASRAYLDARNERGLPALHEAVRWRHSGLTQLLIDMGAGVNRTDSDGRTALHHAAIVADRAAARTLLDAQALVNARDHYDYTPLHMAARSGHDGIAKMLIEAGADVNARIDVGFTALDLAEAFPGMQELLGRHGGRSGTEPIPGPGP